MHRAICLNIIQTTRFASTLFNLQNILESASFVQTYFSLAPSLRATDENDKVVLIRLRISSSSSNATHGPGLDSESVTAITRLGTGCEISAVYSLPTLQILQTGRTKALGLPDNDFKAFFL